MGRNNPNRKTGRVILPDWLGSGQDLFGTIQIIKGKQLESGYLEMDSDFRFSDAFNYPIVFRIRSGDGDIEIYAISFRINSDISPAARAIEEKIIVPKVCKTITRQDLITFFADVVQRNVDFALYINEPPKKFQSLVVCELDSDQRLILNDRLIMKITMVLDERTGRI